MTNTYEAQAREALAVAETALTEALAEQASAQTNVDAATTVVTGIEQRYAKAGAEDAQELGTEYMTAGSARELALSRLRAAEAAVKQAEAGVKQAKAEVTNAQLKDAVTELESLDLDAAAEATVKAMTPHMVKMKELEDRRDAAYTKAVKAARAGARVDGVEYYQAASHPPTLTTADGTVYQDLWLKHSKKLGERAWENAETKKERALRERGKEQDQLREKISRLNNELGELNRKYPVDSDRTTLDTEAANKRGRELWLEAASLRRQLEVLEHQHGQLGARWR